MKQNPVVKIVHGGEPTAAFRECRRMLVGPRVNQPEPFPGYTGFVGWQSPVRLNDGTLLVGFSAGYWHASPPTPLRLDAKTIVEWRKAGLPPDIDAPRGGKALIMRSTDEGRSWSRPETLIDTPWDDRAPNFCQLRNGTVLCSFFTYPGGSAEDLARDPEKTPLTGIIRSFDAGKTWEQTPKRLDCPFTFDATDGPIIELRDGSALLCVYGNPPGGGPTRVAFFRTEDSGDSWQLLSTLGTDHEMSETAVAELPDGRLVLLSRPEGDISWSSDGGRTWTTPVAFGIRLYEPRLLTLKDGTLLALHGSYGAGGFRAIFSTDGGATWICPAKTHGFAVDPSVYGYGQAIELPDGSVFAVYIDSGGHTAEDANAEALWAIRLRVRSDHRGIDLLPASGPVG